MFNKEFLFINAIKYANGQLKLDYKKIKDEQIVETNNSAFLADSDIIPIDIAHKLNSSQSENQNSYISTLLINDNPTIKPIGEAINSKEFDIAQFNQEFNIVTTKTSITETTSYFHLTGLDYIYSAFHIMNLHLEENVSSDEMLVFLFNNKAYILIVNKNSSIVFNGVEELITFEHIKKTHFYNNDMDRQMLFDEVYFFELNSIITNTLSNYYAKDGSETIKKITILYTIKQITNEQLEQLRDETLIKVDYHPINIDEEIFELSKNRHFKKSFIKPRKKKKKSNIVWFIAIILTMILIFIGFKYSDEIVNILSSNKEKTEKVVVEKIEEAKTEEKISPKIEPKVVVEEKKEEPIVVKKEEKIDIKLPDHIYLNEIISNKISTIFGVISYDVVLKDIRIEDNVVVLNSTLLKKRTFEKSLKPNLEKLYKEVDLRVEDKNKKALIDSTITLKDEILSSDINYKNFNGKYDVDKYLSTTEVDEVVKSLMPKNAIIKNLEVNEVDYVSKSNYKINILTKSPVEFFNLIDRLNAQNSSININYPISMKKTLNGIEIEFNLVYNQGKK